MQAAKELFFEFIKIAFYELELGCNDDTVVGGFDAYVSSWYSRLPEDYFAKDTGSDIFPFLKVSGAK